MMKIQSPAVISGITDYGQMRVALYQSDRAVHAPLTAIRAGLQPEDADLTALAALSGTGIPARTAADTWALRTLAAPAAGITISNPAGVAGNPTLALADDLAAVEGIGTTGLVIRSAANTWSTVTRTTGLTFSPIIVGASTAGVGTYGGNNVGFYSQKDDVVTFTLTITWTGHTGTGNMRISNMPVTPIIQNMVFPAITLNMTGSTSPAVFWTGTVFNIVNAESGAGIGMDTAASIIVSGSYLV